MKSKKPLSLAALAAIVFALSCFTPAIAAENSQSYKTTTLLTAAGPDLNDQFIRHRLGLPVQTIKTEEYTKLAMGNGTISDAGTGSFQVAAGPAGASSGNRSARGPSTSQKVFWGIVVAAAANLITGGASWIAQVPHALLTIGGGVVGATVVADYTQ